MDQDKLAFLAAIYDVFKKAGTKDNICLSFRTDETFTEFRDQFFNCLFTGILVDTEDIYATITPRVKLVGDLVPILLPK